MALLRASSYPRWRTLPTQGPARPTAMMIARTSCGSPLGRAGLPSRPSGRFVGCGGRCDSSRLPGGPPRGLEITGVVSFARPCFWSGRLSEQHLIDRRRTAGEPRCRAASAELAAHQVEFVAAAWPRARRFDRPSVLALVGVVTIAVDCSRPRNLAAPGPARSARRHDRHSVEHTRFG